MSLRDTLKRLLEAAQRFEMKTPKYQRIDSERHGLREAITDAQLVLRSRNYLNRSKRRPLRRCKLYPHAHPRK